jgi:hypothetical protein
MGAQQKYLYQYAYLDGSSFNAVENNNLYNDERGNAEILQNYNHNSLNLNFKAGEHTAKALSVLLANSEVGLILEPITHEDLANTNLDVYDLVKIGNVNMTPNLHFYEVGGEFLSNQINNVDFLTRRVMPVAIGDGGDSEIMFATINDGTNNYIINAAILTNGITSFYYPTGDEVGAPLALIDLRDMAAFSITFSGNAIPANFLSGFVNAACEMTITNAISIMKIGDNAFRNSEFSNIIANFSGIRELGSGVQLAKTGGEITTANPLGLVAYADLSIVITNEVQEIDNLIIASDFFASGSQKLLNDTCNALSHFKGTLTEIKNCTIVEDFADLTNLDMSDVIFDNCTFAVDQDFSGNPETRNLTIRNCNQQNEGSQTFTFTGFSGSMIIENSFKSADATYEVDDTAAYALEIDNNSFINAGTNSGSLNKVLTNENRNLPTFSGTGAFLRINGNNIVSFSGTSFLTNEGTILTIAEITSIVFSAYNKWNLQNGHFSFANLNLSSTLYLYNDSTKESYVQQFISKSFDKFTHNSTMVVAILASQLLQILAVSKCFRTNNSDPLTVLAVVIYNDLPYDFNYLSIVRNDESFIFNGITNVNLLNDANDYLKNRLSIIYPEYLYA